MNNTELINEAYRFQQEGILDKDSIETTRRDILRVIVVAKLEPQIKANLKKALDDLTKYYQGIQGMYPTKLPKRQAVRNLAKGVSYKDMLGLRPNVGEYPTQLPITSRPK